MKEDQRSSGSNEPRRVRPDRQALLEELASFEAAIAIRPDYAKAWYGKAVTLAELDRLEEALTSFEEAIRLKPDYAAAWFGKAVTLRRLKKKELWQLTRSLPTISSDNSESSAPMIHAETQEKLEFKPHTTHNNRHDLTRIEVSFTRQFHPPQDRLDSNPFNLLEENESLVVDGSNLIRHVGCEPHNGKPCNNPGRIWILLQLLEQEEKWEKTATGGTCFIVIDASLRHHVDDQTALEALIKKEAVIQMPPGYPSDHLVLQLAEEMGAVILSNDSKMRKEYSAQYPWIREEHRFMKHVLVSDKVRKIEYMRRPRPAEPARGPQGADRYSNDYRKAVPTPKNVLNTEQAPVTTQSQSVGIQHKARSIAHQLGLLTNRNLNEPPTGSRLPCPKCGALIDGSNGRVKFCYRCRAPILSLSQQ